MGIRILVIDDEPTILRVVRRILRAEGHTVLTAVNGFEGLGIVQHEPVDLVITDLRMPEVSGLKVVEHLQVAAPSLPVMVMSAFGEVRDAVEALQAGAVDYLCKPFEIEDIVDRVQSLEAAHELRNQQQASEARLHALDEKAFIGDSLPVRRLLKKIALFAPHDAPALILGETGTGKELIARRMHALGGRPRGPFVAVNCAAIPEQLIEAELFGAERGAYTGAIESREGRFRRAHGGTLFLDEVAELPLAAQAKLLRVLQEGAVEPVGGRRAIEVDVRVVSATHCNLEKRLADGRFREDLYYRLNVLSAKVPPLRERGEDLMLLTHYFMEAYAKNGESPGISLAAWDAMRRWRFPGNVRELEHAVRLAIVLSDGSEIQRTHLPERIAGRSNQELMRIPAVEKPTPVETLRDAGLAWERTYVLDAVVRAKGSRTAAARALGISRKNLWQKLTLHDITNAEIDLVQEVRNRRKQR